MTPAEYRAALATLGLSQLAAGRWLGVSPKTAQNYATKGPSGPAARAVGMAVALMGLERMDFDIRGPRGGWIDETLCADGDYVRHSDLTAAVGLVRE